MNLLFSFPVFLFGLGLELPTWYSFPLSFCLVLNWDWLYLLPQNWICSSYHIWGLGLAPLYRISYPRIQIYFAPHQKACHNARIRIGIGVDSTQHTVRIQIQNQIPTQIIPHLKKPNSEPNPIPSEENTA